MKILKYSMMAFDVLMQGIGFLVWLISDHSGVRYSKIFIYFLKSHHAVAPVLKRVIQYFNTDFTIGLTATDQRPDKKKLETVFGTYSTSLSLKEAMEKEVVAKANIYRIETNIDLSQVRINGKDYVNADLELVGRKENYMERHRKKKISLMLWRWRHKI